MSQTMDRTNKGPAGDAATPKANGKLSANGGVKQGLAAVQSLGRIVRRAGSKGPKVTADAEAAARETGSRPPPSPSPSSASAASSSRKNLGSFFQRKEEDENTSKGQVMKRSKTDPTMTAFGENFVRKSIRRSLQFGAKKDKDKSSKLEPPGPEGPLEEKLEQTEEGDEEEEQEEKFSEIDELYILPDLPHTPMSVMQISKLIDMEVLEEAHLNLLALRLEFQEQLQRSGLDSPIDLVKKEKDLSLLYGDLRNKINTIVRDSNSLPSRNKGLLVPVARIIQEEEKRAEEPGGLHGSWTEAWREAVRDGVRVKVEGVHLQQREQSSSWLSVHLGLLGKTIVDDLEGVKRELRWSYPPSFRVFSAYVGGYHTVVGQHLKMLEQQTTELRDLYALLDWTINRYRSERIMGNLSLQPEMWEESSELELEENFLQQLKVKYCCRVKTDMRASLDRIIQVENEDVWTENKAPSEDSPFHVLYATVDGIVRNSREIDPQLEKNAVTSCLEELTQFPKGFECEFVHRCGALRPQPLWTNYHISYINCFTHLQQHMEGYASLCPAEVDAFRDEAKGLIQRLTQRLEDQFKEDVKPFLRRMMTRKWLTNDKDFEQLGDRLTALSEHCRLMMPQHVQAFVGRLHAHVLREFIGQLMKDSYSCKNRKHERAAAKIREQWEELVDVFRGMTLPHEWMYPAGDDLSDIIGQRNKEDIKDHLEPVVERYPDFSRNHLLALLNFRGLPRGRERRLILRRFAELKKKVGGASGGSGGDRTRVLFADMEVAAGGRLCDVPSLCLGLLLPDS